MPHVTFIHGIANKPAADILIDSWRRALAKNDGIDLGAEGVTSSMVYWADIMYEAPKPETDVHESAEDGIADTDEEMVDLYFRGQASGSEKEWTESLIAKYHLDADVADDHEPPVDLAGAQLERIPLPGWMKKRIMATFLRDVHHYLWDVDYSARPPESFRVQQEIRRRVQEALQEGAAAEPPHIVVSHSMGTVIAYDNLKRVPGCPQVDGLMTLGSPLGLDEIQDQLQPEWTRDTGFPETVNGRWINIYDRIDPVAGLDPVFANDYRRDGKDVVIDINEQNWGRWRHSITKYLAGPKLRQELGSMLDL